MAVLNGGHTMATTNDRTAAIKASYAQPFVPLTTVSGVTLDQANTLRLAHAAEYVAAQLGTIARTAEKTEQHLYQIAVELHALNVREAR